jgi:hypothetical protein
MPSRPQEPQNRGPVLKGLACRNCDHRAFSILLITDYHLYLRCDQCGEPLAIPERRRAPNPTCSNVKRR